MAPQRLFHDTEKAVRDIQTAFFAAQNKAPEHTWKCICLYDSVLSHISKTSVFAAAHHPPPPTDEYLGVDATPVTHNYSPFRIIMQE